MGGYAGVAVKKQKKGSLVHTVQHMRRREYGLDGYRRRGTSFSVATVKTIGSAGFKNAGLRAL
jgi:hypothetical protein